MGASQNSALYYNFQGDLALWVSGLFERFQVKRNLFRLQWERTLLFSLEPFIDKQLSLQYNKHMRELQLQQTATITVITIG